MEQLPPEVLVFLLGSLYCETDRLSDIAWSLFGHTPPGWARVQAECKLAVDERAQYGAPEWPWLAFSSFLKEPDYVKTGKAIAIEPDAKIKSVSDTSMRVRAICNYDLRAGRVEDVIMVER